MPEESLAVLIGRVLRRFREDAELSQSKLARKIDVADATIQRIESGKDTTTTTIQAILDELGRTGAELLRSATTPPYPVGRSAGRARHLRSVAHDPPGHEAHEAVTDPAAGGVLVSATQASALGLTSVVSQRMSDGRVTPKVASSVRDARRPSPAGRR
jgi:transcriptional regulator with XRE-family HTH domain